MGDTLASNIYLGDVSSQIWEFLMNPRPCVFANTHKVAWDKDPNYLHWHTGLMFDITEEPSSRKVANAILQFMNIIV